MIATVKHGPRLGPEHQILTGSGTCTPGDIVAHKVGHVALVATGVADQFQGVADHVVRYRCFADNPLQGDDLFGREGWHEFRVDVDRCAANNLKLLLLVRIVDIDIEHEPIKLRLGQRIGPFLFDRVLGSQDEERFGQRTSLTADRDLVLLHRFEQRRLGLRRSPIDFVGQNHVGKDRAFEKAKLSRAACLVLLDHFRSGDVRRHQVGRELNSVEIQRKRFGQRANHQCLGQPRHANQQRMAAGEQGDHELLNHLLLTDDRLG